MYLCMYIHLYVYLTKLLKTNMIHTHCCCYASCDSVVAMLVAIYIYIYIYYNTIIIIRYYSVNNI